MNFRSLQERLRERLLAHINAGELTGMELARQTGFRQAHISNFLNRRRGLSLEAMDAILQAMQISLADLMTYPATKRGRTREKSIEGGEYVSIPVMEEADCTAPRLPKSGVGKVLKIASAEVHKLRPRMHTPRPHWDRFVALRVKDSDAQAMAPRLLPGAVVIVDRHYNSLAPWKNERNMYLVNAKGLHIRYVEHVGEELILRSHNAENGLVQIVREQGQNAIAAIVGRVCWMQVEL